MTLAHSFSYYMCCDEFFVLIGKKIQKEISIMQSIVYHIMTMQLKVWAGNVGAGGGINLVFRQ